MATRAANARRAASRTRGNDENAIPGIRNKSSLNQLGPAQKVVIPGKQAKPVAVKAGTKRAALTNGMSNGGKEELMDAKPGKAGKAERQPLQSRTNNQQTRLIAPAPTRRSSVIASSDAPQPREGSEMDVDMPRKSEVLQSEISSMGEISEDEVEEEEEEEDDDNWLRVTPEEEESFKNELARIKAAFDDDVDMFDTTMVAEYAEEIFEHMEKLERDMMPNPRYMDFQSEIEWTMRTTLIDWLLQVHLRYHMLPETLWIAVNLVDRFLSVRVVSLIKLQLVGVTAMFIAAKYEEILAPSVDEFVFMTEQGYKKDEILKGERIILQTLDFNVSTYCSPYSWVRRISKADDYDIQTRTLSKFLMEVTLLDHRFIRCGPKRIAAISMYLARKMLSGDWNDAFVYYSDFVEAQLLPGAQLICERLCETDFDTVYVYKKYSNKKFLRASAFARDWALTNTL